MCVGYSGPGRRGSLFDAVRFLDITSRVTASEALLRTAVDPHRKTMAEIEYSEFGLPLPTLPIHCQSGDTCEVRRQDDPEGGWCASPSPD